MPETTSYSLLSRMKIDSGIPWEEFHRKYHDLLALYGRVAGLDSDGQEELVNDVLFELFHHDKRSLFRYDRSLGKFRCYLKTIANRRAIDLLRRQLPARSLPIDHPAPDSTTSLLEQEQAERKRLLMEEALKELRDRINPQHHRIFLALTFEQRTAQDLSREFGLAQSSIYAIKSRVQNEFRKIYAEADEYI